MQILVVVANTEMRTFRAEVEKGSMRTSFGHGLVDPKARGSSNECEQSLLPKGNLVNIPEPRQAGGNTVSLKNACDDGKENFLFFLTFSLASKSDCLEQRPGEWNSSVTFHCLQCFRKFLKI